MLLISPAESLCVLKGSSSLGSLQLFKSVLTIVSRFMGHAKQMDFTWLKIPLFGVCLKQLGV